MSNAQRESKEYLTPPKNGFWRWSEQGDAIIWDHQSLTPTASQAFAEGSTIVFQQELAKVVEVFVADGAPPLGAILLLIAATRDNWWDAIYLAGVENWQSDPKCALRSLVSSDQHSLKKLSQLVKLLNSVNKLDNDVRLSLEAKQTLADVVLGDCRDRISAEATHEVLRLLRSDTEEILLHSTTSPPDEARMAFRGDMRALLAGLERVDAVGLRSRRATGLDQPIGVPEVEIPSLNSGAVRSLVEQLQDDLEFSGIARAARQLMSVVSLPRPISQLDTLEQGGVSDITNRGPLDRLLLSELAYDDLTLAVRVAVNEAMYLRKESPPKVQNRQRLILLDCGIRMWGIPRIFATSLALAMGASGDQNVELGVYSAEGDGIGNVDLTSRAGLQKQLSVLRHEMHSGSSLSAFAKVAGEFEGKVEKVLITCPDAVEDKEFAAVLLQNSDLYPLYIASVDRNGECRLIEVGEKGRKEIRRVRIDIDRIAPAKPKLIRQDIASDLPAFFGEHPSPLLFPSAGGKERSWCAEKHIACVLTNDKRLLVWTEHNRGGREISQRISTAELLWGSEQPTDGLYYAITKVSESNGLRLLTIDLDDGVTEQVLKVDRGAKGFCIYMGAMFVCYGHGVSQINLETAEASETLKIPAGVTWVSGRFFRRQNEWFALAGDSLTFRLEPVPIPSKISQQAIALFERQGIEGPIVVTQRGDLYFTSAGKTLKVNHGCGDSVGIKDIGPNGDTIMLQSVNTNRSQRSRKLALVEVPTGRTTEAFWGNAQVMELNNRISERTKRNRFLDAGIHSNGVFFLRGRKRQVMDFEVELGRNIRLKCNPNPGAIMLQSTFNRTHSPKGTGFKLSAAVLACGSKIFLDSRGLLHFQSSNEQIPEFTFTLSDNCLAGWSAAGQMFGPYYYVGKQTDVVATRFYDKTIRPFVEHCLKSC